MKIYQLHEYSGSYEDFRDYIIGSYLRKERAEEEKAKAEVKEAELMKQDYKCNNCPFIETDEDIGDLLLMYPDYCSSMKLEKYDDYDDYDDDIYYCSNRYCHWDEATFKIKEVEVEE